MDEPADLEIVAADVENSPAATPRNGGDLLRAWVWRGSKVALALHKAQPRLSDPPLLHRRSEHLVAKAIRGTVDVRAGRCRRGVHRRWHGI